LCDMEITERREFQSFFCRWKGQFGSNTAKGEHIVSFDTG